ncbi:transmembrane and coiled-coil domains protein 2-like [Zonotrichia leucophrys gambelii]|uniref:transmembrane and coiled-coil domains protein 2-like n=1 Tax=Zonotrichia leucophrys gambelii TaxID=257770 RepID=UPI003140C35E
MKRCRSDELQQPEEDPGAAGESPGHGVMEGKAGEAAAAPEAGAVPAPPRSKPPDLKKIQQLSEGSMFSHGLKHLFHSRRRSRERDQQSSQEPATPGPPTAAPASCTAHGVASDHDSPDEKERSPEMHRVSYAVSLHDLPARPTAFNRVLQQIRSRPSIKRGTSLHGAGRRAKSGSLEPQKGSPHLGRKAPQDSGLTAILHQHQGRPRSSSTTDTAILLAEGGAVYLLAEDGEGLADKVGMGHLGGVVLEERRVWSGFGGLHKSLVGSGFAPRSLSTTDTAILLAEGGAVYLLAEDGEGLADKIAGSGFAPRSLSTTDTAILLAEGGAVYLLAEDGFAPRSLSTTDTAILLAEGGAVYLLAEDGEGLADKQGARG